MHIFVLPNSEKKINWKTVYITDNRDYYNVNNKIFIDESNKKEWKF